MDIFPKKHTRKTFLSNLHAHLWKNMTILLIQILLLWKQAKSSDFVYKNPFDLNKKKMLQKDFPTYLP